MIVPALGSEEISGLQADEKVVSSEIVLPPILPKPTFYFSCLIVSISITVRLHSSYQRSQLLDPTQRG